MDKSRVKVYIIRYEEANVVLGTQRVRTCQVKVVAQYGFVFPSRRTKYDTS
jgi:hypothetical protein